MCSTNCRPLYCRTKMIVYWLPEGGSVDRWLNQARLFGTITGTVANPVLTASQ